MKLKKLTLKNIRSYDFVEINFPNGSLLLSGDVGVGKTTILMAIEYSFFGLQPGQKGSALLRNTADSGEVFLELEVDGKEIVIERKLKRSKTSVTNDSANLKINGVSEPLSLTEVKSKILDLLGYPSEFIRKNNLLFRYTVYTPQEQMKQIILEDIDSRLNVLRHIFGIDKYKRMRNNSQVLLSLLKERIQSLQIQTSSLYSDRESISKLNSQISQQEDKSKVQEQNLSSLIQNRIQAEELLAESEKKVRERETLISASEKTHFIISSKLELVNSLQKECSSIESKLNSEIPLKFDDNQLAKSKLRLSELENSKNIIQNELSDCLANMKSLSSNSLILSNKRERVFSLTFCPTCLQSVPDSHKYNILNEVERELVDNKRTKEVLSIRESELSSSLLAISSEIVKTNSAIKEIETAIIKESALSSLKESLAFKLNQIRQIQEDLQMLQNHYSQIKEEISLFSKHVSAHSRALEVLSLARREERDGELLLENLRTTRNYLVLERTKLLDSISKKEKLEIKLKSLTELYSWLDNSFTALLSFTERNVLLKLRSEFAKFFNKWFKLLIVAPELDVQLDENFTPLILQGEVEMEYSFLSGGERTAIALAYRLALNQIINSLFSKMKTREIIILDEPTDGFSEAQLDKMRDIFSEINAKQLILVSHEQKIEGFVDNVIKLNKKDGSSQIEGENLSSNPHQNL